jgi:hypothetical protein
MSASSIQAAMRKAFASTMPDTPRLPASPPTGGETLAVLAGLLVFLVASTVVVGHGSQHADAVMDAEPAINVVLGHGRVSFAHPQVLPGARLTDIAPLYGRALAAWVTAFGISAHSVMSMNCVLVAMTALLLWVFVSRWQLIETPWLRVALAVAVPLITPVATIYRINRYDSLGMCGLAAAAATLTVESRALRLVLLLACGFLAGTGGFHVIIGGGLLSVIALAFLGRRHVGEFFAFNTGVATGLAVTLAIIMSEGALEELRTSLAQNGTNAVRHLSWYLMAPIRGGQKTGVFDADLLLVGASVCAFYLTLRSRSAGGLRSAAGFGLTAGIVIPIVLSCFGRYSNTYVWVAAVPMFVGATIAVDAAIHARAPAAGVGALLLAAVLAGFPAHALVRAAEWTAQDRAVVEAFIAEHLRDDDVAYSCTIGYYPAKKFLHTAFIGSAFHSMTDQQRNAVNLLVMDGRENGYAMYEPTVNEAIASFGGEWDMVAELTVPRGEFRSRIPPKPKSDCTYHVMLYRKRAPERE